MIAWDWFESWHAVGASVSDAPSKVSARRLQPVDRVGAHGEENFRESKGSGVALPAFRGDRLRVARMAAGITEEELAGRLGLSSGVRIQAWESGIVERPRPRFLPPLAAELGIDPMSLLEVDPTDPPLAALRLVAGQRMQDVSELTGMHPMTYQRLESTGRTGRRLPLTDELIGRLAAAFGTPPANVWAALEASRRRLS